MTPEEIEAEKNEVLPSGRWVDVEPKPGEISRQRWIEGEAQVRGQGASQAPALTENDRNSEAANAQTDQQSNHYSGSRGDRDSIPAGGQKDEIEANLEPQNQIPEPAQDEIPEPITNQIPEPLRQIPEPVAQIPEPLPNSSKERASQIPEPKYPNLAQIPEPVRESRPSQIPEPIRFEILEPEEGQIPEPGEEINTEDLLSADRQLWRLETYADRHKTTRCRRVLRFVSGKPPQVELGKVTDEIAEDLKQRRGRGRWAASRVEAEDCRLLAYAVAEHHQRAKAGRRRNQVLQDGRRDADRAVGRMGVSEAPDSTQRPDVPNLLRYRNDKIAKAS